MGGLKADDDDVVGELDFKLSQPPSGSELHVLQYPLRTVVGIGADRSVKGVSLRPKHGRVEVRLAVLPNQPPGEMDDVAMEDGCGKSFDYQQENAEEKAIGATQCLRSGAVVTAPNANYAIGAYTPPNDGMDEERGAFVVVPLRGIAQLRPTFDYLDEYDAEIAKQRAEEKAAKAIARGTAVQARPAEQPEDEDVAPLQVSFRRRETERAAERRKNSHAALRRKEEEEPWVEVDFYHLSTPEAIEARHTLFASSSSPGVAPTAVKEEVAFETETSYMDLFRAHTRSLKLGIVVKGSTDSEPLSMRSLRCMPANVAVSQVITHARLARFEDLRRFVADDVSDEEVINATRIVAVTLRGCWVAKKCARPAAVKPNARAGLERFEAARVLILNLFRTSRAVSCHDAIQVLGDEAPLSKDGAESVLAEVADKKQARGWVFRMPDQDHFKYEYSELCQAQDADWDHRVAAAKALLTAS